MDAYLHYAAGATLMYLTGRVVFSVLWAVFGILLDIFLAVLTKLTEP